MVLGLCPSNHFLEARPLITAVPFQSGQLSENLCLKRVVKRLHPHTMVPNCGATQFTRETKVAYTVRRP